MGAQGDFYIFGDQSEDTHAALRNLITHGERGKSLFLESLFERSYQALRSELSRHVSFQQIKPPSSSSLLDLLEKGIEGPCGLGLQHGLTTISHIGLFIRCVLSAKVCPRDTAIRVLIAS